MALAAIDNDRASWHKFAYPVTFRNGSKKIVRQLLLIWGACHETTYDPISHLEIPRE